MRNSEEMKLRSAAWFDIPGDPLMTALYLERYVNFGLTREELQSGKPIIGALRHVTADVNAVDYVVY